MRVLVVDDDDVIRRLVRRALHHRWPGLEVVEAETAEEGLNLAGGQAFDCIVMDYLLPDMDGRALLEALRARKARAPVVALTGHGDEEVAVALLKAGAVDYLAKRGLTADRVTRAVEEAVTAAGLRAPPKKDEGETFAPGSLVGGRYRIQRALGHGATSRAVLATDEVLDRNVVLKALHASTAVGMDALLHEARILASVEDPNVVRVHDFGDLAGVGYLVLEYVEGGSLEARLASGRVSTDEAVHILDQILAGLAFIHGRGIVHGDLKPANVLLTPQGTAKLTDFGLSTMSDPESTSTGLMVARGALGTPAYMSPEVASGRRATALSDIYAAGALLYRLVAGQCYIDLEGRSPAEVLRAILTEVPRTPENVDVRVLGVVLKALEKDPGARFASAEDFRGALRDLLVGRARWPTASETDPGFP